MDNRLKMKLARLYWQMKFENLAVLHVKIKYVAVRLGVGKSLVKTHGSVSCGPRNPERAIDKCVFYRSKENTVFTYL